MNKKIINLRNIAFLLMGVGIIFFILPFVLSEININTSFNLASIDKLGDLGSYLSGTAGLFVTLSSVLFLYLSIQLSIDSVKEQQQLQKQDQKLQSLRDFETLFFNLCNGLNSIKTNNPFGINVENEVLQKILERYPYSMDQQIVEYSKNGDLDKQLIEERIIEVFDSLILYVVQIIKTIDSRLVLENESFRSFYYQQLSYRLSKEELRMFELVSKSTLFNPEIINPINKLEFRNYNLSLETSLRKQQEIQKEAQGWENLGKAMYEARSIESRY